MIKKINANWRVNCIIIVALLISVFAMQSLTVDNLHLSQKKTRIAESLQSTAPDGWFLSGSQPNDYKTGFDAQIFQHGQKSGFIESTNTNPTGFTTLMQQCNVKDFKGKRIKMTGYIKTQEVNPGSTMWIRIDDFDKKNIADFDNMGDRPIAGTQDWRKCEIIFDVPDSQCSINFGFILSGSGKIWVDNVSFEIVSSSIEKTAFTLNQDLPEEMVNRIPEAISEKAPANLDFEE